MTGVASRVSKGPEPGTVRGRQTPSSGSDDRPAPGPVASITRLQGLAGNRAVTGLLEPLQRDDQPGGAVAAGPEAELTNARFRGDRILLRILRGEIDVLSERHNGRRRPVGKVQHALKDSGFDLPLHRVDGAYGPETEDSIEQFRSQQSLPEGRKLDGQTLGRLDQVAPPPGQATEHTVDYGRLLADSTLTVTAAIGFTDRTTLRRDSGTDELEATETPVEEVSAERFRGWLRDRGFEFFLHGADGAEHWHKLHEFTWLDADGQEQAETADVWVRLVTPGPGAASAFRQGVSDDELTLYHGHARYGSGPDFDDKESATENFRIGIDEAMAEAGRRTSVEEARRHGVAVDEEHDLQEMVASGEFDPERYRVLFVNACTSMAYLDELRSEVGGQENLDVVGTREPVRFTAEESRVSVDELQVFLAGVLAGDTVQDIVAALEESQVERFGPRAVDRRGLYTMSGVGDNPVSDDGE